MNDSRDPECQRLADAIPDPVHEICQRLASAGHRSWAVGGCVRDVLRGTSAEDWDIATDARPQQITSVFRRVIPTGIKHGTVTVLIKKESFEVTTLRGESAYEDGRRPEKIAFLDDIEDDLARRDFTFNAIAFDPIREELIDPFGGRRDLAARQLRAVGVAIDRFAEDGLRVMRAARFAATLECAIHSDTLAAMGSEVARDTLRKVSVERVRDEWLKAMRAKRPSIAFQLMREAQLLGACCPPLAELPDPSWDETMRLVDATPVDPILRLAALLHGISGPASVAQALKLSKEERGRIEGGLSPHPLPYDPSWTDAEVRRFLQRIGKNHKDDVIALGRAMHDASTSQASPHIEELARRIEGQLDAGVALTTRDLALDGGTLIAKLSLSPGPGVGRLLRLLLERVTEEPELNRPEPLLAAARQIASESDLC